MREHSTTFKKTNGVHYTPNLLSDFVANQIGMAIKNHDKYDPITILDPAIGDGELVLSMAKALRFLGYSNIEVQGFDTDASALESAKKRFNSAFPNISFAVTQSDFLSRTASEYSIENTGNLFLWQSLSRFDIVISNPPYVRTQVIVTCPQ